MRVGYGINRHEREFEPFDVAKEKVWLDTDKSGGKERARMFNLGLVDGDTLVLLSEEDLGRARKALMRKLDTMGVAVEVHAPKRRSGKPGAPRKWNPEPDDRREIGEMWHDLSYSGPYVIRRAGEITDYPVERHHMQTAFGNREIDE